MNNPKISRVKKQQQKYLAALTEMHNTLKSGGSFLAYEWMKKHKLNNNTTKCLVELKAVKRDKLLAAPNWRWTGSEPDLNLVKSILLRCKVRRLRKELQNQDFKVLEKIRMA